MKHILYSIWWICLELIIFVQKQNKFIRSFIYKNRRIYFSNILSIYWSNNMRHLALYPSWTGAKMFVYSHFIAFNKNCRNLVSTHISVVSESKSNLQIALYTAIAVCPKWNTIQMCRDVVCIVHIVKMNRCWMQSNEIAIRHRLVVIGNEYFCLSKSI